MINYVNQVVTKTAYKFVISKPRKGATTTYEKINILKKENYYQAECYTAKQVFHFNYKEDELKAFVVDQLEEQFLRMNAWDDDFEYQLNISKKGKVALLKNKRKSDSSAPNKKSEHNRTKNYILLEGEAIPPLVDMGIFTKEGKVVAAMYDKYKQINRFLELINDSLSKYKYDENRPLKVVDFGCGKSYLTFVLYYFLTEIKHMNVQMIGLDLKEDVIKKCNASAQKYGYVNLSFQVGDVGCYEDDVPADMIITLHACDTATDYALFHAIRWNAKMIFSVPCCQHELNSQFETDRLSIIGRYGIVKERTMALMTDAIRANLLEYCGYKTNLMEFVDFENTPKNLLIRAVNTGKGPLRPQASCEATDRVRKMQSAKKVDARETCLAEVYTIMEEFHVNPTLYQLLHEANYI